MLLPDVPERRGGRLGLEPDGRSPEAQIFPITRVSLLPFALHSLLAGHALWEAAAAGQGGLWHPAALLSSRDRGQGVASRLEGIRPITPGAWAPGGPRQPVGRQLLPVGLS
jgi:hypothetical protein